MSQRDVWVLSERELLVQSLVQGGNHIHDPASQEIVVTLPRNSLFLTVHCGILVQSESPPAEVQPFQKSTIGREQNHFSYGVGKSRYVLRTTCWRTSGKASHCPSCTAFRYGLCF